jgi:hypothetical protein
MARVEIKTGKVIRAGVLVFLTALLLALGVERFHVLWYPGVPFNQFVFIEMIAFLHIGLIMSAVTSIDIYKLTRM